jgi:two-component system, OmpR family, sensor kinase
MGRLFWKFFFFFWLAQFLASACVGVGIWLEHRGSGPRVFEGGAPPPPPDFSDRDRRQPQEFSAPGRGPSETMGTPPRYGPLLPILAGGVVSLLFAALLAWYFAKPIRNLRVAFELVAGGQLKTRIGKSMGRRNDELADLGNDFDRMASRLDSLLEAQRRLLHDVSHELRSPLARLQVATELIRQQPERTNEFIERIERDTGRIDKLIGDLLRLARLDAGMAGAFEDVLDLHEILVDIVEDARFEAEGKLCHIDLEIDGPVVIRGSHELLYRALENVVRNALRHSPDGAAITVSVRTMDDGLRISIADNGPGVFAGDLASIFDPFVRSGSGRTSSGHGLGLAITRRVVEAHGGSVSAANRPEGGLVVVLLLPRGLLS